MRRLVDSSNETQALRIRIATLAVLSFAVGAAQTIKVNVIGEAALSELLLPVIALSALVQPGARRVLRTRVFWVLLLSMTVTLIGYMVSDLVQESSEPQYLRGWGRISLVMADFASLSLLVGAQRQCLWWFAAGMGIGRMIYLRLALSTPISLWKFSHDGFGYAEPITLAVATLGFFLPPRLASLVLAGVGFVSVYYDFRIQSAVCLIIAGLIWARAVRPAQPLKSRAAKLRFALLLAVVAGAMYAGLQATEDEYSAWRRGSSDIGRAFGKVFAMKAIANSPWLGYGSWSRNTEFLRLQREAVTEVAGPEASKFLIGDSSSATHSMILQAWVEGGILGTAFFFVLGFLLIRNLPALALTRPFDALSPLLVYFAVYGLWHIVMSAFAAPLRLQLALAAVSIVCVALERKSMRGPPTVRGMRTVLAERFSRRGAHVARVSPSGRHLHRPGAGLS